MVGPRDSVYFVKVGQTELKTVILGREEAEILPAASLRRMDNSSLISYHFLICVDLY